MVSVTATHRSADPNTKTISSSVLMPTILGLAGREDPLRTHINAAHIHSAWKPIHSA
jgi:hypothetical protein